MSPPDDAAARRIVQLLDQGLGEMDAATRDRLAASRARAMARHRERPLPVWSLAWAGNAASRTGSRGGHGARYALAAAALVVALTALVFANWQGWQGAKPGSDIADIDASLLTDELPINAYLDKGFDSWLKRGSR